MLIKAKRVYIFLMHRTYEGTASTALKAPRLASSRCRHKRRGLCSHATSRLRRLLVSRDRSGMHHTTPPDDFRALTIAQDRVVQVCNVANDPPQSVLKSSMATRWLLQLLLAQLLLAKACGPCSATCHANACHAASEQIQHEECTDRGDIEAADRPARRDCGRGLRPAAQQVTTTS